MSYIAGVLLMHNEEKKVFQIMNSLMENYSMKGFYMPDMPKLKQSFYVFVSLLKNKFSDVFNNFKRINLTPTMYAS